MELRRSWTVPVIAAVFVVAGPALVFSGVRGGYSAESRISNIFFGLLLPIGAVWLWRLQAREPFQFRIDAEGITTRQAGEVYRIGWRQIELVILDEEPNTGNDAQKYPPRLLIVPGDKHPLWNDLRQETSTAGRTGLVLLDLTDVHESHDAVADLLRRYAGSRFVDERHEVLRRGVRRQRRRADQHGCADRGM